MTRPIEPDGGPSGPPQTRPVVDARQLWVGGIATAIVAALVALVGVLVCRWLFKVPLLSPQSSGTYGDAHTTDVVILAAAAALLATGLAHLLLVAAPRPMTFLTWIVARVPPRGGYDENRQDTYPQQGRPGGYNQGGYDQSQWGPSGRSRGPGN